MTDVPAPVGEDELMGYVDGRLSPERAEAVRAYLAAHPEAHERLSHYAEQRQALRAVFASVDGSIPTRLRIPRLIAERRRRDVRRIIEIAAAICLLAVGGIGGWSARDFMSPLASPASVLAARTIMRVISPTPTGLVNSDASGRP